MGWGVGRINQWMCPKATGTCIDRDVCTDARGWGTITANRTVHATQNIRKAYWRGLRRVLAATEMNDGASGVLVVRPLLPFLALNPLPEYIGFRLRSQLKNVLSSKCVVLTCGDGRPQCLQRIHLRCTVNAIHIHSSCTIQHHLSLGAMNNTGHTLLFGRPRHAPEVRIRRKSHSFCAKSHGAAAVKRVPARATTARRSTHECPPVASSAKKKINIGEKSVHKCPGEKSQHQWMNTEAVGACSTNVLPFLTAFLVAEKRLATAHTRKQKQKASSAAVETHTRVSYGTLLGEELNAGRSAHNSHRHPQSCVFVYFPLFGSRCVPVRVSPVSHSAVGCQFPAQTHLRTRQRGSPMNTPRPYLLDISWTERLSLQAKPPKTSSTMR
ncbi:hypothetical protein TcCL_NonESM06997 [Trypanosoma cruzi]|nr:hypothetical protein TcCL_NonESM06997 [Trypanosoma cruzi]